MAHIPLNEKMPTSRFMRLLFWYQKRRYGSVPEPLLAWAYTPSIFKRFLHLWNNFNRKKSPLPADLRSLVSIVVSQANSCVYCSDLHSYRYLQSKKDKKKVDALPDYSDNDLFTDAEKKAFDYAKLLSACPVEVSDTFMNELKTYYDDRAIVELTALISFQNMSSKFNSALNLSSFGFCQIELQTPSDKNH